MNKDYALNEASRAADEMGPGWVVEALREHASRGVNRERAAAAVMTTASTSSQSGRGLTESDVNEIFTYHDDPIATPHYVEVREAAKAFAKVLLRHVPSCADQTAAMRKLRECVMTANAGIALSGRY